MRASVRVLWLSTVFTASVAAAPPVAAQKPKDPPKPVAIDVKPAIPKIKSGEEAQIKAGLDEVRIAGTQGAPAAPAIAEVLGKGLSLDLTISAIETLGDTESEQGSAAIAAYTTHRNSKVRRAAIKSLTRTKGTPAIAAFKKALSDNDPVVRGTAASGLGAIKAKDSVADLFLALNHRVNEAAASIGQLCNAEECDKLAGKLGSVPFDVVTGGLDQALFRQPKDVSDDTKVKIIGKLHELGTAEANKFLKDVQKRWPEAWKGRVKQSLDQAVQATTGGLQ